MMRELAWKPLCVMIMSVNSSLRSTLDISKADQLRKLQLELAELKMENEMLKKAAAYFAKNLK